MDNQTLMQGPPKVQAALQAWRYWDPLRKPEFAVVMSSGDKDVPPWARWSDPANVKEHLRRFKKPLLDKDAEKSEPLAFLVVRAMLLTGFEIRVTGFRDIRHDIVP